MLDGLKKDIKTYSKTKKMWVIVGLLLLLTIPIAFLNLKIDERKDYRNEAYDFVSKSWGEELKINSPKLKSSNNKELKLNNYKVEIKIENEYRKKGVFKIPVYTADVKLKGDFLPVKDISHELILAPMIEKTKYVTQSPTFKLEGKDVTHFNKYSVVFKNNNPIPFEITYKIKGSKKLSLDLAAVNSTVNISGNSKNIAFSGENLPNNVNYSKKGFVADWEIVNYSNSKNNVLVTLTMTDEKDNYVLAYKSLKYSFFFLFLIFISYFIFEIVAKKQIHPFQYMLLGATIFVFYLLLVALSEVLPFSISYILASLMTLLPITFYTYFVITRKKDIKFSMIIAALLSFSYLFFYILLKLEEYSFLVGSLGIFAIIILIMYCTRNINWVEEN